MRMALRKYWTWTALWQMQGRINLDFASALWQIDEHIKGGRSRQAVELLRGMNTSKIPREHIASFANLSWRAGLPTLALRVLSPIITPKPGMLIQANDREKLECACALIRIGGFREAQLILQNLDAKKLHKVYLYSAFVAISQWDYKSAISPLLSYIETLTKDSYEWAVAATNLAAAYLAIQDISSSSCLLTELKIHCKKHGNIRLLTNIHELLCQLHVLSEDWNSAKQEVQAGHLLISETNTLEALFFQKWQTFAEALQFGNHKNANAILKLREKASLLQHWETVRDCDLYLAKLTDNDFLFNRVYYGTPYEIYRDRICRLTGRVRPQSRHLWLTSEETNQIKLDRRFDIESGHFNKESVFSKHANVLHRMLIALARDLYRPARIASLHHATFPDEHYSVEHSPNRVHQIIFRLRKNLNSHDCGISIEQRGSLYQIQIREGASVRICKSYKNQPQLMSLIEQIFSNKEENSSISTHDITQTLGCTLRSAQRLLKQAHEQGLVTRTVVATKSVYNLKPTRKAA